MLAHTKALVALVAFTIALCIWYLSGMYFSPFRFIVGSFPKPCYDIPPYKFSRRNSNEAPRVHYGAMNWSDLPDETRAEMTMYGQMEFQDNFYDDSAPTGGRTWHRDEMVHYMDSLAAGKCRGSYQESCDMMKTAFERHKVEGKSVIVLGSQSPWIEAIAIYLKAGAVHTVDFQKPVDDVHMPVFKILNFSEVDQQYDFVASYSSLEHDGLGRYGDPIHPNADLLRMKAVLTLLKDNGLFLLGIPVGPDLLSFNAHRIYGLKRMPKLIEDYVLVDYITCSEYPLPFEQYAAPDAPFRKYNWGNQPILVLKKRFV